MMFIERKEGGSLVSVGRRSRERSGVLTSMGIALSVWLTSPWTIAQELTAPLSRTSPNFAFESPLPEKYNLNWGRVKGRFRAALQAEFNDNVSLSESNPAADFIFGPELGVGFFWPLSHRNILHLDIGFGYRRYLEHPGLSSFYVTPDTHLDYRIWIKEVQVNFHDDLQIQVDPTARPELSQGIFNFRRLVNSSGVDLGWQPYERWTLRGGYNFVLDRSLNSEFRGLDRDGNEFNAGVYYAATPRWTLGTIGSYSFNEFLIHQHNDYDSWSAGPIVVLKWSEFLSFEGSVAATRQVHQSTGTIQDGADFTGITYSLGARHTLNSWASHSLRFRRSLDLGVFSNYTDNHALQYSVNARVSSGLSLTGTFGYQHFQTSGNAGEQGDVYMAYLGTNYKLNSKWSVGLGYTLSMKDSELAGRDYIQNRVTAVLQRQF